MLLNEFKMLKSKITLFSFLVISIILTGCAKRGTITGGAKDTIPPVIVSSNPKNFSSGFKGDQIKIFFNEYIKVKDISKQLIISPPMKNAPYIVPMGNASKFISIKINDTLKPNTTYSFNFGQSITDNNEGNPYSQFKYVFSTGDYIDSLKLGGVIKDAYSKKQEHFVSVQLYEAETFNDSTIYKKQPRYLTNTLDSASTFLMENLKKGNYYLVALKDENGDYKYNPGNEKIAFFKNPVAVPNDTIQELTLFKEEKPFKALKPVQVKASKLILGYEGHNPEKTKVKLKSNGSEIPHILTRFKDKDSLQIWLPNTKLDSLQILVEHDNYSKTFKTKLKEMKATDTLSFKAKKDNTLSFRESFSVSSSIPLIAIDNSKIKITKGEAAIVPFTTQYQEFNQELVFDFKKEENEKYKIEMLPGAVKDFYGKANDSLSFGFSTRKYTDYGNLKILLEHAKRFPIIIEILDSKENVVASQYIEKETPINFDLIEPALYTLRVIYDDDKNKVWTTGDYMLKRQPEEIIYFPKEIDVRANWDVEQPFTLSK